MDYLIPSRIVTLSSLVLYAHKIIAVLYWEPSLLTPLQEAHKMVDFVLRHGNDLLAVECLRGFEVSQQIQQVDSRSPVPRVLPSFHLLSVELGQVPKVLS